MLDLIDYIQSSPYKPYSSATLAYKKFYRKSIKLAAKQLVEIENGIKDPELALLKRQVENRLYKLRNFIPTKPERNEYRKTERYKSAKIRFFNKAVFKQLNIEKK